MSIPRPMFATWAVAAVLPLVTLFAAPARADAPQILGIIATAAPVPLQCADGRCTAELSTFCLQPHRPMPRTGTTYKAAKGTRFTLHVMAADGTARALPVTDKATIASSREFAAVNVSFDAAEIAALGTGKMTLSVDDDTAIIPAAMLGERQPQTEAEIAAATGSHRALAGDVARMHPDELEFAQMTGQLINALPLGASAPAEARWHLWRKVFGKDPVGATTLGEMRAQSAYFDCRRDVSEILDGSMRECLQHYHDGAMEHITLEVWKAIRTGI